MISCSAAPPNILISKPDKKFKRGCREEKPTGLPSLAIPRKHIATGGAGASLVSSKKGTTRKFNSVLVDVAKEKVTHQVRYID